MMFPIRDRRRQAIKGTIMIQFISETVEILKRYGIKKRCFNWGRLFVEVYRTYKKKEISQTLQIVPQSRSQLLKLSSSPSPLCFKVGCEDINENQTDKSNSVGAYWYGHQPHYHQGQHPQSNPVNTDTAEGVGIKQVMLLKSKRHLLLVQNTIKGIKKDLNIVKCNISNLHKAVIPRTKSTETLKNRSSIYFLIKTVLCVTWRMPK